MLLLIIVLLSRCYCKESCKYSIDQNYAVYSLPEKLNIDGVLDEPAWTQVPWSNAFIDIRGKQFWNQPWFTTKVKLRYDDRYLYIGAYLEESNVWGTLTKRNSIIYKDNDFEIFIDPDGTGRSYKEIEVNALNTIWNLEISRPYRDGGAENSSRVDPIHGFDMVSLQSQVYIHGNATPNHPEIQSKYWTVEMAIPLLDLVKHTNVQLPVKDKSQWRINFSRIEYLVSSFHGKYRKVPHVKEENWVWASTGMVDIHMPEKWGYIEFRNETNVPMPIPAIVPDKFSSIRHVAFAYYYAQQAYWKKYTKFATKIQMLYEYDAALHCIQHIALNVHGSQFNSKLSMVDESRFTGNIDQLGYFSIDHVVQES